MRLSVLLVLPLAGCALYFGSDDPPTIGDPPIEDPGDQVHPEPPKPPTGCGSPEVHVVGVYEASSDHSTPGTARVAIERPGRHVLVLSAYEATNWQIRIASDATKIRAVHLVGYEEQTVDLPGVPVTHGSGCGYSYPYNGQGCDTNALLAGIKAQTGLGVTSFHGCYQASQWTLHADRSVASNCNTAAGYKVNELLADCGGGSGDWEQVNFSTLSPPSCTGSRYVRHDERYNVWVGAILCGSSDTYKLYMSGDRNAPFLEIADYAGHGQDHCELVNPAFKIPDEDDITSGGCAGCSVGDLVDVIGIPVYARARFGEPFQRVQARHWADLTTTHYSCGVAIP